MEFLNQLAWCISITWAICLLLFVIFACSCVRCKTCGEYIYKGKKFNARKETVQNEVYLGLPIFRFYIKCTRCLAEITFKVTIISPSFCFTHMRFPSTGLYLYAINSSRARKTILCTGEMALFIGNLSFWPLQMTAGFRGAMFIHLQILHQ